MRDLLAAWRTTAAEAGARDGDAVAEVGADLLRRWREPHRRYHDEEHLREVLDAVDLLAGGSAPARVRLAVWFHDAVYEGLPGNDEARSAALAGQLLTGLGVPGPTVAAVAALVRMTATHRPAADDPAYTAADGDLLCDGDLAILAAGPARYARYVSAVRSEYAHVPDDRFRTGRAAVLRALVAAPTLYRTDRGRRLWEDAARANVAAELARLDPAGVSSREPEQHPGG